jgi:hypothetical protein
MYDSGTSLWHNVAWNEIQRYDNVVSKPFREYHQDQIKLVKDFKWFDVKQLNRIDEEFENLLENKTRIEKTRRDILCASLKKRVEKLDEIVMERGHEIKKSKSTGFDAGR